MAKRQRKRGGFIRSRGEGRWLLVLSWTDETGTSRQTSSSFRGTRQEAEAALAEKLRGRAEQVALLTSRITLGDYLQVWMRDHVRANLAPKTAATYEGFVKLHIGPALGHHQLKGLRPAHIQRYLTSKLSEMSPRSVKHHFRVLHTALAFAVRWQYIPSSPAARVTPPRVDVDERALIELDDVARIVVAAAGHPGVALAIILAVTTGLRRGELIALTWGDVDLDGGVLSVKRSAVEVDGTVLVGKPKTKRSRREVSLPSALVAALRQEKARQVAAALEFGSAYRQTGRVISMHDGSPMLPTYLTRRFSKLAKQIGVHGTFHDLRHAHASALIAEGVDMVTVAERLGHASAVTTAQVYAHVAAKQRRAAADESGRIMDRIAKTRD